MRSASVFLVALGVECAVIEDLLSLSQVVSRHMWCGFARLRRSLTLCRACCASASTSRPTAKATTN